MKQLRIVFMGTPEFAVAGLDALMNSSHKIVGVITAPDRPAGRGRKLQQSAVKQYAVSKSIPVLQPTNLKNKAFLSELKALNANLNIVVAFRMLPKVVWNMPEFGTFNLHASLLPNYRGAAPINWAIINGETKTGVTTFFIDEKIDTGAILYKEEIAIQPTENAGALHDKLMALGAGLIVKTVNAIADGDISTTKQVENIELQTAYKIHKETCNIDWTASIDTIYNHIRGLSPYPGAWTTLIQDDEASPLKIFETEKELANHQLKTGTLICSKKEMKIVVKEGYLNLKEIQLPGKKKMGVANVLNGVKFSESAYVR